jgi:hypothetical protein
VLTEISFGWVGSAALSGGLAHVDPLLQFPIGRRATTSVAARQVRRRHLILVIRATGAPQTRSSVAADERPGGDSDAAQA